MIYEFASVTEYKQKKASAIQQFNTLISTGQTISIKKNVKHIFKERDKKPNLDLRHFNQVLSIDTDLNTATVEGMTSFYTLVEATLAYNLMPQVVPELRSITVGGAIAGLGGQSSSFKFGLVHEMISDFELLTGEGKVILCSPESNADIFYMLPNSYGSLGYVLKCTINLNKVAPYVKVQYLKFSTSEAFFSAMVEEIQASEADFLEGASFSPSEYFLLKGSFSTNLPPTETCLKPLNKPFFKSIRDSNVYVNYLTIKDYIWRWDPDAFWATDQKNLLGSILLNPLFRKTIGGLFLRSDRLIEIGKYRNRLRKKGFINNFIPEAKRKEALIQDAAIPIALAQKFEAWLAQELHIFPLWLCPVKTTKQIGTYPLYKPASEVMIDFGFYISMELEEQMESTYYNRSIENKLVEIGGLKCLYSDTFFSEDQFWKIYDKTKYDEVKSKYDPNIIFLDLYQKVVNKVN